VGAISLRRWVEEPETGGPCAVEKAQVYAVYSRFYFILFQRLSKGAIAHLVFFFFCS